MFARRILVCMAELHPHDDDPSVTLQVRIRRRQLQHIDDGARAIGISRSEAVRAALSDWTAQADVIEERRRRLAEGA